MREHHLKGERARSALNGSARCRRYLLIAPPSNEGNRRENGRAEKEFVVAGAIRSAVVSKYR